MKQSEISIGMIVGTKVGDAIVKVKVVAPHYRTSLGERDRWIVKRVDNGRELPKARTASALRPVES